MTMAKGGRNTQTQHQRKREGELDEVKLKAEKISDDT